MAGHRFNLSASRVLWGSKSSQGSRVVVNSKDFFDGSWHKFGVCGDNHLYSKYARLDGSKRARDGQPVLGQHVHRTTGRNISPA